MPDNLTPPDAGMNTSGQGKLAPPPAGVAAWSWGAFLLSWIWAIGNRTWWGLFGLVPGVGLVVRVLLGMNGRRWAWQNRRWDSVAHFNRVQRRWSVAGVLLSLALAGTVAAVALSLHQDRQRRQALETAFAHANRAAQAVARHAAANGTLPGSLGEAGFGEPPPASVQGLALDPRSGVLRVTVHADALRGKAFSLVPTTGADGAVGWRCLHGEIPARLLPKQCSDDPSGELAL